MLDIKQLLQLARIEMDKKEQKQVEKELGAILGYVKKLKEINVDEAGEMTHALEAYNEMREDNLPKEQYSHQADLVDAAPHKYDGFIKVKEVFNNNEKT